MRFVIIFLLGAMAACNQAPQDASKPSDAGSSSRGSSSQSQASSASKLPHEQDGYRCDQEQGFQMLCAKDRPIPSPAAAGAESKADGAGQLTTTDVAPHEKATILCRGLNASEPSTLACWYGLYPSGTPIELDRDGQMHITIHGQLDLHDEGDVGFLPTDGESGAESGRFLFELLSGGFAASELIDAAEIQVSGRLKSGGRVQLALPLHKALNAGAP